MPSNERYLTTQETADLLSVSSSTVRRWVDDGILECCRVGKSKYRKFECQKVMEVREKYYGDTGEYNTDVSKKEETRKIKAVTENIKANAHPAHYLMHKYWGRKPHNVVSYYIENYTSENDVVLEPFMGSGVTVIEAVKLKRHAIGIDINPMSKFIVQNTLSSVDLDLFTKRYNELIKIVKDKYENLYSTRCPICGGKSIIETGVWNINILSRIKGICPEHGSFIKDADEYDEKEYDKCVRLKKKLAAEAIISYPTEQIMKYVKRSGRERIDELFSDRALIILSEIRNNIRNVKEEKIQNLLMFCFTSMLSNVSRMLPGDLEKVTYKSGWVISKFWTPKIHTERNVFMCMNLRYKAIVKGKKELLGIDEKLADIKTGDSTCLKQIEDNSIDYIFTDPPYGESIAYLALSQFWNSWLQKDIDYADEIIIDPYRNKDYQDYATRTKNAYKELYRVLKPDHYMSFTFHNRDLNVWKAILDACNDAGFVLENIILQEQAVSSGTQGINKKNTLTGDFVYNFIKRPDYIRDVETVEKSEDYVSESIQEFIDANNGATPSELYEYLIPLIVKKNAYTDSKGNAINIENILKNKYEYVEIADNNRLGGAFKWVQKQK